jgi:MOSC domain-containing protein YiiM
MPEVKHLSMAELEAGLDEIRRSPRDEGTLTLIVRRPETDGREVLEEGELTLEDGLVGDNWKTRARSGEPNPDTQLNVMNARSIALISPAKDRWQLAGDQLFLDIDLSNENLPPGSQLAVGDAVIQVTEVPHTGCKKFVARFGMDAMNFVNSAVGRQLNLRGINARVVKPGAIRTGDAVRKL